MVRKSLPDQLKKTSTSITQSSDERFKVKLIISSLWYWEKPKHYSDPLSFSLQEVEHYSKPEDKIQGF